MYDNLMNKFKFGGIDKPGIYIDENVMRMCYTHRRIFTQLVQTTDQGRQKRQGDCRPGLCREDDSGVQRTVRLGQRGRTNGRSLLSVGRYRKSERDYRRTCQQVVEYLIWYLSLDDYQLYIASENFMYNAGLLDAEVRLMEKYKSEELAKHYSEQLDQLYNEYVTRMKGK